MRTFYFALVAITYAIVPVDGNPSEPGSPLNVKPVLPSGHIVVHRTSSCTAPGARRPTAVGEHAESDAGVQGGG